MKKLLLPLIILIVILSMSSTPLTAVADNGDYIKIDSDTVGFYRLVEDVMAVMFYLPEDSYALLIFNDDSSNYYLVRYNNITGFIKKSDVPVGLFNNITNPYSDTDIILNAPKLIYPAIDSNSPQTLAHGDKLTYIGQLARQNTLWYAVKRNAETTIYFVKHSDIYVPAIIPDPDPTPTPTPNDEPSNNLIKSLLIIGIIIPAVIIVLLLFKPRRRKPRSRRYVEDAPKYKRYEDDYYYDEDNDY